MHVNEFVIIHGTFAAVRYRKDGEQYRVAISAGNSIFPFENVQLSDILSKFSENLADRLWHN